MIALKARQLGLTWIAIAVSLWYMLFRPGSAIGLLSARDTEAVELLKGRLKGMYRHLPDWLREPIGEVDNDHHFELANGSSAVAFPTGRGDSYTLTFAVVDEADIPDNLDATLKALDPTIDAGGKLFLLSKVNKERPKSLFKKIYHGAENMRNGWKRVFLPWSVRPERNGEWYAAKCAEAMENTGSLDTVHENYPATDAEALADKSADKRIAAEWLNRCFEALAPVTEEQLQAHLAERNEGKEEDDETRLAFTVRGLTIYRLPEPGRYYVIGADPAEGNPTSDGSALEVLDRQTWEQVATLDEKLEPEEFGSAIDQIGRLFNDASVMCERNNHGHAVLLWLKNNSTLHRFRGEDKKPGWLQTEKAKHLLIDAAALAIRQGDTLIHNSGTLSQLGSIEGATLKAPKGQHDDRAIAFALAVQGAKRPIPQFV